MSKRILAKAQASSAAAGSTEEPKDDRNTDPRPNCCVVPPEGDGGPIKP